MLGGRRDPLRRGAVDFLGPKGVLRKRMDFAPFVCLELGPPILKWTPTFLEKTFFIKLERDLAELIKMWLHCKKSFRMNSNYLSL